LLDEPFTGLDYYDRYVIAGIINKLVSGNGVSVIVASSTMDPLSCLNPSRVYHVNNGRLVPLREQHELVCDKSIALRIKDIYEGAVPCSEN
jgi:ABC-type multidrug transport system ATPase subunit